MALLDIIDGLPPTARLREAILSDPRQAELIATSPEYRDSAREEWRPKQSEWSLLHEMIASFYEAFVRANSDSDAPEFRFPRPVSLVDEYVARAAEESRAQFIDSLMTGKYKQQ